jgi:hypothetical protein
MMRNIARLAIFIYLLVCGGIDSSLATKNEENVIDLASNTVKKDLQRLKEKLNQQKVSWLVSYASLNTKAERVRFQNPHWVFWKNEILNDDGVYFDNRSAFLGNASNLQAWKMIADVLPDSFNMITSDWGNEPFESIKDKNNKMTLLSHMIKILKEGGEIRAPIEVFFKITCDEEEEDININSCSYYKGNLSLEEITKEFPVEIMYVMRQDAHVPLIEGGGGDSLCKRLPEEIVSEFLNENSACVQERTSKKISVELKNQAQKETIEILKKLAEEWSPPEAKNIDSTFKSYFLSNKKSSYEELRERFNKTFLVLKKIKNSN